MNRLKIAAALAALMMLAGCASGPSADYDPSKPHFLPVPAAFSLAENSVDPCDPAVASQNAVRAL